MTHCHSNNGQPVNQLYPGTVVTSFYDAVIPTRGNWFQANQPDLESDDCALLLSALPMRKIWHFSGKIWLIFVTVLWFNKTEIADGPGGSCESLVRFDFQNLLTILALFLKKRTSSYNFCPIEITWRKLVRSVCLTPVSMATWLLHNMTSTFHCTNAFADKVIRHNPPLPGLSVHALTWLEPRSNRSQHKTNGELVQSNSSVNQILLVWRHHVASEVKAVEFQYSATLELTEISVHVFIVNELIYEFLMVCKRMHPMSRFQISSKGFVLFCSVFVFYEWIHLLNVLRLVKKSTLPKCHDFELLKIHIFRKLYQLDQIISVSLGGCKFCILFYMFYLCIGLFGPS